MSATKPQYIKFHSPLNLTACSGPLDTVLHSRLGVGLTLVVAVWSASKPSQIIYMSQTFQEINSYSPGIEVVASASLAP